MMKKQIIVIHGGGTFARYKEYLVFLKGYKLKYDKLISKGWKDNLAARLGGNFEVISPKMPNAMNATYKEWEIMFKKLLPFLKNNVILIGHSLGGAFLVKYLSANKFPKKILATFLVAAPFEKDAAGYSLLGFTPPKNLKKFAMQAGKVFLYHSKDDPVVPFSEFEKYKKALPKAARLLFKDRGHFDQDDLPELVGTIKKLGECQIRLG